MKRASLQRILTALSVCALVIFGIAVCGAGTRPVYAATAVSEIPIDCDYTDYNGRAFNREVCYGTLPGLQASYSGGGPKIQIEKEYGVSNVTWTVWNDTTKMWVPVTTDIVEEGNTDRYAIRVKVIVNDGYEINDDTKVSYYNDNVTPTTYELVENPYVEYHDGYVYVYIDCGTPKNKVPSKLVIGGKTYEESALRSDINEASTWHWDADKTELVLDGYNDDYIYAERKVGSRNDYEWTLNVQTAYGTNNVITDKREAASDQYGLFVRGGINLTGGGNLTVNVSGDRAKAIVVDQGDVNINMKGALNLRALTDGSQDTYGISATDQKLTIQSIGDLNITASYRGIVADDLELSGSGDVTLQKVGTGQGGQAIWLRNKAGTLAIGGSGSLDVSGFEYGLYSNGDVVFSGTRLVHVKAVYEALSIRADGKQLKLEGSAKPYTFESESRYAIDISGYDDADSMLSGTAGVRYHAVIDEDADGEISRSKKVTLEYDGPTTIEMDEGYEEYTWSDLCQPIDGDGWSWDPKTETVTLSGYHAGGITAKDGDLKIKIAAGTKNSIQSEMACILAAKGAVIIENTDDTNAELNLSGDFGYGEGVVSETKTSITGNLNLQMSDMFSGIRSADAYVACEGEGANLQIEAKYPVSFGKELYIGGSMPVTMTAVSADDGNGAVITSSDLYTDPVDDAVIFDGSGSVMLTAAGGSPCIELYDGDNRLELKGDRAPVTMTSTGGKVFPNIEGGQIAADGYRVTGDRNSEKVTFEKWIRSLDMENISDAVLSPIDGIECAPVLIRDGTSDAAAAIRNWYWEDTETGSQIRKDDTTLPTANHTYKFACVIEPKNGYAFGDADLDELICDQNSLGTADYQKVLNDDGTITIETGVTKAVDPLALKSMSISASTYTCDGKVHHPAVTVLSVTGDTLAANQDYTVSYASNCKSIGMHTIKVTGIGSYEGELSKTIRINPAKVSIKTPKVGKGKITVKYAKAAGGVSYRIAYKLKTSKKWKYAKSSTTSKIVKKLKHKKYYNVKVQAYRNVGGKTYYGAWSKTKTVKVK